MMPLHIDSLIIKFTFEIDENAAKTPLEASNTSQMALNGV